MSAKNGKDCKKQRKKHRARGHRRGRQARLHVVRHSGLLSVVKMSSRVRDSLFAAPRGSVEYGESAPSGTSRTRDRSGQRRRHARGACQSAIPLYAPSVSRSVRSSLEVGVSGGSKGPTSRKDHRVRADTGDVVQQRRHRGKQSARRHALVVVADVFIGVAGSITITRLSVGRFPWEAAPFCSRLRPSRSWFSMVRSGSKASGTWTADGTSPVPGGAVNFWTGVSCVMPR
jgi:hypothetical protein